MAIGLLNFFGLLFILIAVFFARQKKFGLHKTFVTLAMMASFGLLIIFLVDRASQEGFRHLPNSALGFRIFLISHILAALITFLLSLVVVSFGLSNRLRPKWHRRLAYFLLPIWIYSSITGLWLLFLAR